MKPWQIATLGILTGIAATLSLGAIAHTDTPRGPYLQMNPSEIVNVAHIDHASFSQLQQPPHSNPSFVWCISLRYESGKEDLITFTEEAASRTAWHKLQDIMNLDPIPAPPGSPIPSDSH